MITLNELVYDIMELVRGNNISDDTDIDERQVIFHINNQRALWLRNEYNKPGRALDHNIEQDLGHVKLITADPAECPDIDLDCDILRTENTIPNSIELHSRPGITRVGPVNKIQVPFSFVPYQQATYSGSGKYTSNGVFAFLLNNYIYLKTTDKLAQQLDYINIRGVFEDPEAAADFVDCDGKPCFTRDSKYPLNSWMVPMIKERVLQQFGMSLQTPKDQSNNAKEDIPGNA